MAANYVLLERIELNASAASVTFSNIPQSGYTDLKVVTSARSNASTAQTYLMTFNGSSTGYSDKSLEGTGSAASSFSNVTSGASIYVGTIEGTNYTASTFGNQEIYIPNYTSSNYKSVSIDNVTENNATASYVELTAGLWSNTAAINSVTFTVGGSNSFVQYSTFSLYALAAVGTTPVIAPKASGGNITTDGTYWYHTFLTTGAFVPATNLTCDALVVAGGASGGNTVGGGGGAGGLLGFTSQSFAANTSYTATIGAGGASNSASSVGSGINGNDSQLGSLTLVKGGGGGGGYNPSGGGQGIAGSNGGSGGGGGGGATGSAASGGTATSGQGNNGGYGGNVQTSGAFYTAGGGGGAGAAGGNAVNNVSAGAGGAGVNTYSSWATATGTGVSGYYAGGGAGCLSVGSPTSGGAGGGGNGGSNSPATSSTAGIANTGGGGGGQRDSNGGIASAGGSGIVIIRYTIA